MLQLKDTCVYVVKNNEDIVFIGTTDCIDDAKKEHIDKDHVHTDILAVTDDMTADKAKEVCVDLMNDFVGANEGEKPLYNN